MDEYHDVHEMQNDVQHNYVVDSDADYTSDSNIISYDQYVEDNEEHVVQCNASSVRNDALMSILDEMHEQGVQSRLTNKPNMVMNDSMTSELARYKRTRRLMETIHVTFDEMDQTMAPVRISSGPEPIMMFGQNCSSLVLHQMTLDHNSSSLGLLCQKMFGQNSLGLVLLLDDV
ncbi:hypothetical protein Tco_0279128 [Tanacetum coccineum]